MNTINLVLLCSFKIWILIAFSLVWEYGPVECEQKAGRGLWAQRATGRASETSVGSCSAMAVTGRVSAEERHIIWLKNRLWPLLESWRTARGSGHNSGEGQRSLVVIVELVTSGCTPDGFWRLSWKVCSQVGCGVWGMMSQQSLPAAPLVFSPGIGHLGGVRLFTVRRWRWARLWIDLRARWNDVCGQP